MAQTDIEIQRGDSYVEVEGTQWSRLSLSRDSKDRIFSLTPRNSYQIEQGWPEPGIVNVNRKGSKRTTEKNWVGYIPAERARRLLEIVESHGITSVHAIVLDGRVALALPGYLIS